MTGIALNVAETGLLAELVESCATPSVEPVPWHALDMLRQLLDADAVAFGGFDSRTSTIWIHQDLEEQASGIGTPTADGSDQAFWSEYWQLECSWPDRTGDYDAVTTLGERTDPATAKAMARDGGHDFDRRVRACVRGSAPGRQLRIQGLRTGRESAIVSAF